MRRLVPALALSLAVSFPLAAADAAAEDRAGLFDYDAGAPLDAQLGAPRPADGAKIFDVTYASPKGGRVTAYLVVPEGAGPFAGVVFMHWGQGNRASFLPEAIALARAGAESLLLDAPFIRPAPWRVQGGDFEHPEPDRDSYVRTVVEIRRAADLLLARPEVDRARLAYVGHSFGATWGGVVAGIEKRFRAYVLMAGLPRVSGDLRSTGHPILAEALRAIPKEVLDRYIEVNEPLDAVHFVGRSSPAPILFQWARFDLYISEAQAAEYERAAGEPKTSRWYDSGHELNDPKATADRDAWLAEKLSLAGAPPPQPAVARVPEITPAQLARGVAYEVPGMEAVRVTRDIPYGKPGKSPSRMDLYAPAAPSSPVMILVHADPPQGASGDPPDWPVVSSYGRLLAASGVAALVLRHASSDSGLRLQEAASDVESAMRHVRAHAPDLGLDGERIGVWAFGSAAPYALTAALDGPHAFVRCAVASYGPLDLRPLRDRFPLRVLGDTLANYSPAAYLAPSAGKLPPVLLIRAGLDAAATLATMDRFAIDARAAGGTVEVLEHPRGRPGFDVLDDATSREIAAKTIAFVRKSFGLTAD